MEKITIPLGESKTVSAYYDVRELPEGKTVILLEDAGGVVSLTNRIEEVVKTLQGVYGLGDDLLVFQKDDEDDFYWKVEVDLENYKTKWRIPNQEEEEILMNLHSKGLRL